MVHLDYASEIVAAITHCYADNEDMMSGCLAQLANTNDKSLIFMAVDVLKRKNRCPKCGAKMLTTFNREYHSEVDDYEEYLDGYCPECDLGWENG